MIVTYGKAIPYCRPKVAWVPRSEKGIAIEGSIVATSDAAKMAVGIVDDALLLLGVF
jgi:hypothetical protein